MGAMALRRSMPAHSQILAGSFAGCPVVSLCCVAVLCPCVAIKSSCNLGSMSSCADERIDGGDVHGTVLGNEACCVLCHSVAKKTDLWSADTHYFFDFYFRRYAVW